MKLLHLSDLHIGKRVNGFSMLEDQIYILNQIVGIIDDETPDAVLIAGDVYDKSVPSAEAVQVFDDFLCTLAARGHTVFVISGNHDSPERLAFASRVMDQSGIHMSQVYHGVMKPVTMEDEFGPVDIYMLPFVKPTHVRRYYPDAGIESYTDAVRTALEGIEHTRRSVLITHQFVTGATRSESEELSVGGTDNVDASVFAGFDYVALGHIHGPQNIGSETIRYCGTPLKYSMSEAHHKKSVTVVELREKGNVAVRTVLLKPMRDMRALKGTFEELTDRAFRLSQDTEDYLSICLTDEEDVPNAMGRLRKVYPRLMRLHYDNQRTRSDRTVGTAEAVESKKPLEVMEDLYYKQNGQGMSEEQRDYISALIKEIWEVDV